MKAAVLEAFREPLVVREVPDPAPAAHGAVCQRFSPRGGG